VVVESDAGAWRHKRVVVDCLVFLLQRLPFAFRTAVGPEGARWFPSIKR
jgi:hypothetical protein